MSLFTAELRKIGRRKLFPGMTLVLLFFVGLAAFFLIVFGEIAPDLAEDLPVLEKPEVYDVGAQQAMTQTWFPVILSISVIFFAYSTIISWSYYGERCWSYLFGEKWAIIYRWISVAFVVVGAITSATNMLNLGDSMILGMAVPNLFGVVLMSGKVKAGLDDYLAKLKSGELFGVRS